ncbi:S-formylglutathione hydrolase FrmB [Lachnospiraceae bacterium NK3A20]|nr:S-formylglutathione hydrolase FrmB [Lachnospiraceae bacterium NK3A20]
MSYMRFNFRSQTLGHYVDVSVCFPTDEYSYYPQGEMLKFAYDERKRRAYHPGMKLQTVYLIHGGGDDDTLVYRYSNAERYARENNVMLVTPNIANSFGIDTQYGVYYQTFLSEELPVVIQSLFCSSPAREDNFIIGYAMGGNVALGTAILHPEKFAECVDISGGIGMTLDTETLQAELSGSFFREHFPLYNTSFGEAAKIDGSAYDLFTAAKRSVTEGSTLCPLHLIVGSKEFIRERVENDARILEELGYPSDLRVKEGYDHDFILWDEAIRYSLDKLLPLKRFSDKP